MARPDQVDYVIVEHSNVVFCCFYHVSVKSVELYVDAGEKRAIIDLRDCQKNLEVHQTTIIFIDSEALAFDKKVAGGFNIDAGLQAKQKKSVVLAHLYLEVT